MANSTVYQSKWKPIVELRRAKPKTYRQAPTHWLKFYEDDVPGLVVNRINNVWTISNKQGHNARIPDSYVNLELYILDMWLDFNHRIFYLVG